MASAWVEYNYRCILSPDGEGYSCDTAHIPVKIMYGTETFSTEGLLDSGCDTTLVNMEVAEFLEIDLSQTPSIFVAGVGGYGRGKRASVLLHVDDLGEPFEAPVVFLENLKVPVCLGQKTFFDKFNVRFEKHRNKFFVERIA